MRADALLRLGLCRAMDRGAIEELRAAVKLLSMEEVCECARGLGGGELVCLMDALPSVGKRRFLERLPTPDVDRLRDCAWEFFLSARSLAGWNVSPRIQGIIRPAPALAQHELPDWRLLLRSRTRDGEGSWVYVTEENQLLGSLHLLELLDTSPSLKPCPYRLCPDDTMEPVLRFFRRSGLEELPVLDAKGKFLGVIRRQALLRAALLSQLRGASRPPTSPSLFQNMKTSLMCRWIPCAGVALLGWHFLKKLSDG